MPLYRQGAKAVPLIEEAIRTETPIPGLATFEEFNAAGLQV